MNGRIVAIGSGLLVAATSIAVVSAATAAADGHAEAARRAPRHQVAVRGIDPAVKAETDRAVVEAFTNAVNLAHFYEAVSANILREKAAAAAAAARTRRSSSSGSGGGNVLECIKHRESRGQYGVVNSSSGAAGAYQFMPGTWNNTARSAGRTDLVGVNPANASPADQDAMAHQLLATQGLAPWGGGCG